ncbi:MAG: tetratricopeptide repeat protein [Casimicrobiaceae bacterium]
MNGDMTRTRVSYQRAARGEKSAPFRTLDAMWSDLMVLARFDRKLGKAIRIAGLIAISLIPPHAIADDAHSSRTRALLPAYCKYTQSFPEAGNAAEVAHWTAIMGPVFHHMHHYCYGLMEFNYAKLFARTAQDRDHNYGTAVGNFQYVIDRSPSNFVLLPEIYTKQAEAYIAIHKSGLGVAALLRAIELKPDYWPPYADLSDFYRDAGDIDHAREWLQKGLAAIPDAEALRRRLTELGRAGRRLAPESRQDLNSNAGK